MSLSLFLADLSKIRCECLTCESRERESRESQESRQVIIGLDFATAAGVGKTCVMDRSRRVSLWNRKLLRKLGNHQRERVIRVTGDGWLVFVSNKDWQGQSILCYVCCLGYW